MFNKYNVSLNQLPKILKSDAAIKHIETDVGDVIEILRNSPTSGVAKFYSAVING